MTLLQVRNAELTVISNFHSFRASRPGLKLRHAARSQSARGSGAKHAAGASALAQQDVALNQSSRSSATVDVLSLFLSLFARDFSLLCAI